MNSQAREWVVVAWSLTVTLQRPGRNPELAANFAGAHQFKVSNFFAHRFLQWPRSGPSLIFSLPVLADF